MSITAIPKGSVNWDVPVNENFADLDSRMPGRPNLLLNWDFRNPVNRNGGQWMAPDGTPYYSDTTLGTEAGTVVSYALVKYVDGVYGEITVDGATYYVDWSAAVRGYFRVGGTLYTIDRWHIGTENSMLFRDKNNEWWFCPSNNSGGLWQFVDKSIPPVGAQITISALCGGGGKYRSYVRFYNDKNNVITSAGSPYVSDGITYLTVVVPDGTVRISFACTVETAGTRCKLYAAKLELGAEQTLARQLEDGTWEIIDPPDYDRQYALTGLYSPSTGEWIGSQHSNQNLLDNWYFASDSVIDQRGGYVVPPGVGYFDFDWTSMIGLTDKYYPVKRRVQNTNLDAVIEINGVEYVVAQNEVVRGYAGSGYTVDRWKFHRNSVTNFSLTFDEDGVVFRKDSDETSFNRLLQFIENPQWLSGKTVTVSALVKGDLPFDMLLWKDSDTTAPGLAQAQAEDQYNLFTVTRTLGDIASSFYPAFCIRESTPAGYIKIKAVKLELGAEQTLAHQEGDGNWVLNDPPPNRALELEKCQRYQNVFSTAGAQWYVGRTITGSDTSASFFIPLTVTPRANGAVQGGGNARVTNLITGERADGSVGSTVHKRQTGVEIHVTIPTGFGTAVPCMLDVSTEPAIIFDFNL